MPARRLLVRKIREVLRLKHERGGCPRLSHRAIAQACAIGVGTVSLESDLSDSTPARRRRGPVAGGEDGGEVRRPARPRLPSAAVAGGPPVAGEDSERCVPPAGLGSPARRARKRAAATAVEALAGARPWSWSSAR